MGLSTRGHFKRFTDGLVRVISVECFVIDRNVQCMVTMIDGGFTATDRAIDSQRVLMGLPIRLYSASTSLVSHALLLLEGGRIRLTSEVHIRWALA